MAAIGHTDHEGVFVAYVPGIGFRYLDITEEPGHWATAGGFAGAVSGQFGLHYQHGSSATAYVSFVETPLRTWACLRIPAPGGGLSFDESDVVDRTSFPADVVSTSRFPGAAVAAVALGNGVIRFMDLCTGKAVGKGLKLEATTTPTTMELAALAPQRAAAFRSAPAGNAFFVVELEAESLRVVVRLQGTLGGSVALPPRGPLLGAAAVGGDRLLLCWGAAEARPDDPTRIFASVSLDCEAPAPVPLAPATRSTAPLLWLCIAGFLMEYAPAPSGAALELEVRDARFGLLVASGSVQFAIKGDRRLLTATAGNTTALVGVRTSEVALVRLALPEFSLQMVIGTSAEKAPNTAAPLAPLREAASGKRARDDPAVEELFAAKRRGPTDEALAAEVRKRVWPPSYELVDLVVRRQCCETARALLALPELGEDLSIQLLAADGALDAALLAPVVRRASTPRLLEAALRDHLPAALLPGLLEALLHWLDAYRDLAHAAVQEAMPGLPTQADIVRFLSAIADGCLPSLLRLDADLLERVSEGLSIAQKERNQTEHTYAGVHATLHSAGRAGRSALDEVPPVEVMLLDF